MGRGGQSVRRHGGLTRTCSFAAPTPAQTPCRTAGGPRTRSACGAGGLGRLRGLPRRRGCLCWAAMPAAARSGDIVIVHSSDLHIDHDYTARLHGGDGPAGLSGVLSAARAARADVVVLAGDTFDCHRLPIDLLARAAAVISAAALPALPFPGHHAPP